MALKLLGVGTKAWCLRRQWLPLVALTVACAVAIGLRARETARRQQEILALIRTPVRLIAPRFGPPSLDRHRPLDGRSAISPRPLTVPIGMSAANPVEAAAAFLLAGEREQARAHLLRVDGDARARSAQSSNDLAAIAIVDGDLVAALRLLDEILGHDPSHPQALFNRALALEALGLRFAAAESFARVAALGEPGWSSEADGRAKALRGASAAQLVRRKHVIAAGRALALEGQVPDAALVRDQADVMQTWFFEALRTQSTRADVERLRPLARALDASKGDSSLPCERELDRVARLNFAQRAPVARLYAHLLRTSPSTGFRPGLADAIIAHHDTASVRDIVLGALVVGDDIKTGPGAALFSTLRSASGNPELAVIEAELRWGRANRDRRHSDSERAALAGLAACDGMPGNRRCIALEGRLARSLALLYRLPEARQRNDQALGRARKFGFVGEELRLLRTAAELESRRFRHPLARAYLEELLLNPQTSCQERRFAREQRAAMALKEVRPRQAAAELANVPSCGGDRPTFTTDGLAVAGALRRFGDDLVDHARVASSFEALRSHDRAQGRFVHQMAKGSWLLPSDVDRGRDLLASAIASAERLPADNDEAAFVRTESQLQLAVDTARQGNWARALDELSVAAGTPLPSGCLLGVTADAERAVAIVRGADGQLAGTYQRRLPAAFDRDRGESAPPALGRQLTRMLEGCGEVKVMAAAKHRFWTRIIPSPEIAWAYILPPPKPTIALATATGAGVARLVVADPEPPDRIGLPRLSPLGVRVDDADRVLRGATATPAHVLAALPTADLVELHVHGLADGELSEYTALVLSPDRDGKYLLTMSDVRDLVLPRRPIVILAACHAARSATDRPDSSELAGAFVRAGAKGVLAAVSHVPDAEADGFFALVRSGVAAGRSLAVSLRDARRAWSKRSDSWTDDVVAFE